MDDVDSYVQRHNFSLTMFSGRRLEERHPTCFRSLDAPYIDACNSPRFSPTQKKCDRWLNFRLVKTKSLEGCHQSDTERK